MNTETISAASTTIASLLVLLFILAGCAFLVRKIKGRTGLRKANGTMPVTILSSRALGAQQSLVVAQANGQNFLLGVTKGSITLISRLDHHE